MSKLGEHMNSIIGVIIHFMILFSFVSGYTILIQNSSGNSLLEAEILFGTIVFTLYTIIAVLVDRILRQMNSLIESVASLEESFEEIENSLSSSEK